MDPHEVSVSFPENLTRNQALLSEAERDLVASILRHARQATDKNANFARELEAVLSRAVGELLLARVAERAGRDALEEIRGQCLPTISAAPPPSPSGPRPPAPPAPGPGPRLSAPIAAGPTPAPGTGATASRIQAKSAEVRRAERPSVLRAECIVLEEFLAPQELQELTRYTLDHEHEFRVSQVISPGVDGGVIDPEYRRSRVLMDLGKYSELIFERIQSVLPRVLKKLNTDAFPITRLETQITASNDGDFFRHHSDNAEQEIARRQLTFVYFFHREPKAFQGGQLRLHDSRRENGVWIPTGEHRSVVPEQNQIAFFRSELLHEITPVICPSQAFADSRFTVNGWLHR